MKLAKREKNLLIMAGSLVLIILLLQLMVSPFLDKRRRLQRGVAAKERELKEITALSDAYHRRNRRSLELEQVLSRRSRKFSFFSFLEQEAGRSGLKENIKSMRPSVSSGPDDYQTALVEIKLEKVGLRQLTDYLYRIDLPRKAIRIKRISIKHTRREPKQLDAVLQVATIQ
jgi:hypothetical protein